MKLRSLSTLQYSLVPLLLLVSLAACTSAGATSEKTTRHAESKIIYRPKVKLTTTDPDPSKLKTLLKGWKAITQEHYAAARKILLPLAEDGYTDAQIGMAFSYMPQQIIHPKRPVSFAWKKGIPWMKRAADNGNAKAQWLLGDWYFHGFPGKVHQDYATTQWSKVNHYLHAAAEQGLAIAQLDLASLYEDALGVPMNMKALTAYEKTHKVKAYMWYILASQRFSGHLYKNIDLKAIALHAANRLVRQKAFTPAEIAEGKRMVKHWICTHPDAYQVDNPPELYPEL